MQIEIVPNTAVHPRGCGERILVIIWPLNQVGSSPRVRGTPVKNFLVRTITRFIPAGAGNAADTTIPT